MKDKKYIIDHDYHIHSYISQCSQDPTQNAESILKYAIRNNLKSVALTDHFWDESVPGASKWYADNHTFAQINAARPLPESNDVRFLFGCEADMNKDCVLGISPKLYDEFDFIVIATTHMHMTDFTVSKNDQSDTKKLAQLWIDRINAVLNTPLPFYKVGLAHLMTRLIALENDRYIEVINSITDEDYEDVFLRIAKVGAGVEINASEIKKMSDEGISAIIRPYRIAKEMGCKFYIGSDAHSAKEFDAISYLPKFIDALELTEDDKFHICS